MATADTQRKPLSGGELNAAVANALVKVHIEYVGRGPTRAQAFYRDNVVVAMMEEGMTKAERSLVASGHRDAVIRVRQELQATMRDDLVSAVEQLTRRTVVAFMSANHLEPDLATEMFVLDAAVGDDAA